MSILAGIIARPKCGPIETRGEYRKYGSAVTSIATVVGAPDVSVKTITYEIGARTDSKATALAPVSHDVAPVAVAYPTAAILSDLFSGLAKKHSNFSGNFAISNLSGVVERLARALAADSVYPEGATAQDMLGGNALRIHALSTYFSPVGANEATVFIPRIVDTALTPDVFSVLCHAVCGEGGIVATDLVEVNAATREPVMVDVTDYAFAPAVVDALRLLGANMAASDQGELFALAVIRGLNHVLSVVGHTDEGAVMRDILRCGATPVPFGGIHYGLAEYTGLPALSTSAGSSVAGYCDSLLLGAAALVAHCDPGLTYNGSWYPTIIMGAGGSDPEDQAGGNLPGTYLHAAANRRGLLGSIGAFADLYCPALAKLFGLGAGGTQARTLLVASAGRLSVNNRHLRHASVAPYFWIEPTSIIPHDYTGYVAETEGYGAICSRDVPRTRRAWEEIDECGRGDGFSSAYYVRFRGARTCAFLHHFAGHENDGVAHVQPRQFDAEGVIHPGPGIGDTVYGQLLRGGHLGSYLWTRGQSPFAAPGEFLNLGETMAVQVAHMTFDGRGPPQINHVPSHFEFKNLTIDFIATAPTGIPPGALTETTRQARRARTNASRSLAAAAAKARLFGQTSIVDLPILATAPPLMRSSAHLPTFAEAPVEARGGGAGQTVAAVGAHDANPALPVRAAPLQAVMTNTAHRGPVLVGVNRDTGVGGVHPSAPAGAPSSTARDAASVTSATGPTPAPLLTAADAAPSMRAGDE